MTGASTRPDPPYLRIAAEIRGRITRGELRPGDLAPSARAIMRDWGVAMATATKVLAALRAEGLVEARPGVGTVVRDGEPPPRAPGRPGEDPELALTRERITAAAIAAADAEGLDAVSMRRIAADLGVGAMSLYRHVAGKEEITRLMVREVFRRRPLPEPGPAGWRAKLELACRVQWAACRRHPWLPHLVSITRPLLVPEAMAHTEWTLAALAETGLSLEDRTREIAALPAFVQGLALTLAADIEAERATGLTSAQRWLALDEEVRGLLESGRFPWLARIDGEVAGDLDALFEYGLANHLNGLGVRIGE